MELTLKRIIAYCIDGLIVGLPSLLISLVLGFVRLVLSLLPFMGFLRHPFWAFSVTSVVVYIVYESIGLMVFKTTIGKYFMNL